jgi:hypothetical protein
MALPLAPKMTRGSDTRYRMILVSVFASTVLMAALLLWGRPSDYGTLLLNLPDASTATVRGGVLTVRSGPVGDNTGTGSSSTTCRTDTSWPSQESLVIDFNAVRALSKDRLSQIKEFTVQRYEKFVMAPPGREHYTLMEYLSRNYSDGCRHVADVGTRYVASSLALGASGTPVSTFDLPNSRERIEAFRGKTEADWQSQVEAAGVHVTFYNLDLLAIPDAEFLQYTSTWLISLDTHHLPYTVPFEREFFSRLTKSGYKGLLVLDDIHLNDEMKKWWAEVGASAASTQNYKLYDLTAVGHSTGTGLVDFSGRVRIVS